MRIDTYTGKFSRAEKPFDRLRRDGKKQLRREFKLYGGGDHEHKLSALPFNWKNLDLWTRHLCLTPTTLAPGKPGDKSRPSMIYGYFHRDNRIEGVCIVPATTSLKKVYASYAVAPANNGGILNEGTLSAYTLNNVQTITNSGQFFRVSSKPLQSGDCFQTREEALVFLARRIYALLFASAVGNLGNFSRRIFEDTIYEGPVFDLVPGNMARGVVLPDVAGHWRVQRARFPMGITQNDIAALTEKVRSKGYRGPIPLENYLAKAVAGHDPFEIAEELSVYGICRFTRSNGSLGNETADEAAHPVDPEI